MPLFERTPRTYSLDDIIKTVFGSLGGKRLCMQQPMRVTYNGIFFINTKYVNVKNIGNSVFFFNIGQLSVTVSVCNYVSFKVVARTKQLLNEIAVKLLMKLLWYSMYGTERKKKSNLYLMEMQQSLLGHKQLQRIQFESDYTSIWQGTISEKQLI